MLAEVTISTPPVRAGRPKGPRRGHSSTLVPAIDRALSLAGVQPRDLDAVIVGSGPGSFTGIRIAGATAKGIVHALGVPLLAYSSLMTAAAGWARRDRAVGALFDARGREVYAACYCFGAALQSWLPPAPMSLDEAIARCREVGVDVVTGDAVLRHGEEIGREAGVSVAPAHLCHPRAGSLLWLAASYPGAGEVEDAAGWEPDYLRASGAERIAGERAAASGAGGAP
ncbi:MAG TPA: tRNA (adenosine(37)-N6)-threonylcarbamoyltransferase complex dimerization subunit type 1 TsaB [Longimicrobiaceae bacterium]|nr:tRNA (adenosine(37)-N6)-threonylcarbamoyltransferase complex dimerization subunit type 1 TsaB [Longimicrobiaceae bacterium]